MHRPQLQDHIPSWVTLRSNALRLPESHQVRSIDVSGWTWQKGQDLVILEYASSVDLTYLRYEVYVLALIEEHWRR